ncbi:MAG: hypothetical protein JXJ20_05810 [Anaerolineae bacterium]|nr:hypothetical protein [Anaerolineae bacterium]
MVSQFKIGEYRAISLWGARGTRQLLRLKHPGMGVDDRTYDMAYTEEGAERVRAMGFNCVYLMCSWGFPPETEEMDWEVFRRAVRLYHEAGIQVVGGVQVSSCMAQGPYREKDWYALDPWGRRIPCYRECYYTCWNSPDWLEDVKKRICVVIEAKADGVFFGEPWMGGVPLDVGRGLLGVAGCHDARCRAAYAEETGGLALPAGIHPRGRRVQAYLQWRASLIARRLQEWASYAQELNPAIVITVEGCEPDCRNPFVQVGHELAEPADTYEPRLLACDLPRAESAGYLVQNAAALDGALSGPDGAAALSHVGPRQADTGTFWSGHHFQVAMAEACALEVPPVIDGNGFVYRRSLTLLIHKQYKRQQEAIGQMNAWLEQHAGWLNNRTNASPLAVLYPQEALRTDWNAVAPVFWGACQTIIAHGLPFRVVGQGSWDDVTTLVVPPGQVSWLDQRLERFVEQGGRVIALQRARTGMSGRPLWTGYRPPRPSWLHWPLVRRISNRLGAKIWRLRHAGRLIRFWANRLRRPDRAPVNKLFALPPDELQRELLEAVETGSFPRVTGGVLFSLWREPDGVEQWHLVNYQDKAVRATLHAPEFVSGWVYAPGEEEAVKVFGNDVIVTVDAYKVLRLRHQMGSQE